jgi:hypothetical protein
VAAEQHKEDQDDAGVGDILDGAAIGSHAPQPHSNQEQLALRLQYASSN